MDIKINRCFCCGEVLTQAFKFGKVKCKYCHSINYEIENDQVKKNLIQARDEMTTYSFSKAFDIYQNIVRENDSPYAQKEGLWGMLLSSLGILYIRSYGEFNSIPTFSFYQKDLPSLKKNKYFLNLMKLDLDQEEKNAYLEKVEELDKIYSLIGKELEKQQKYDVFLCVKISTRTNKNPDAKGYTKDSKIADEMYDYLTKRGMKVFYSERSLSGVEYDSQILSALVRSKKMVVISSSSEYLETPWVQSEYRRWFNFIDDGTKEKSSLLFYFTDSFKLPLFLTQRRVQVFKPETQMDLFNLLLGNNQEVVVEELSKLDEKIAQLGKIEKNQLWLDMLQEVDKEYQEASLKKVMQLKNHQDLVNYNQIKDLVTRDVALDKRIGDLSTRKDQKSRKWKKELLLIKDEVENQPHIHLNTLDIYQKLISSIDIKKEKRKKAFGLFFLSLIPIGIFIAAMLLFNNLYLTPLNNYYKAKDAFENGNYDQAYNLLDDIDSNTPVEIKNHKQLLGISNAIQSCKNKNFELASQSMKEAGGELVLFDTEGNLFNEEDYQTDSENDDFYYTFTVENYQVDYNQSRPRLSAFISITKENRQRVEVVDVYYNGNPISIKKYIIDGKSEEYILDKADIVNEVRVQGEFIGFSSDGFEGIVESIDLREFDYKKYHIYLNYQEIYYIVFFTETEEYIEPQIVKPSAIVELPEITKEGYLFKHWIDQEENIYYNDFHLPRNSDLVLKPVWEAIANSLVLNFDGGTCNIDGESKTNYTKPFDINDDFSLKQYEPSKPGYDFIGWKKVNDDGSLSEELFKEVNIKNENASKLEYKAIYQEATYQINYILNGGKFENEVSTTQDVVYKDSFNLQIPSRDGFDFAGWYEANSQVAFVESVYNRTENVTLEAKWESKKYSIKVNNISDYYLFNDTVDYLSQLTYLSEQDFILTSDGSLFDGYEFNGWYSDKEFTNKITKITAGSFGDKEVYLKLTPKKYNISVHIDGAITTCTIEYGQLISEALPTPPIRKHEDFSCWKYYFGEGYGEEYQLESHFLRTESYVSSEHYFQPIYVDHQYQIRYHLEGEESIGAVNNPANSTYYTYRDYDFYLNRIWDLQTSPEGMTFIGWYTDPYFENIFDLGSFDHEKCGDIDLYPKYEYSQYQVTFVCQKETKTQTITYRDPIVFPSFNISKGYEIKYWTVDSLEGERLDENDLTYNYPSVKTIYAHVDYIDYNITYVVDDLVDIDLDSMPKTYNLGNYQDLVFLDPVKENYDFVHWAMRMYTTETDYTTDTLLDQKLPSDFKYMDIELRPYFRGVVVNYYYDYRLTMNINFESNGGTLIEPITIKQYEPINAIPTREGYIFMGWYFDKKCEDPFNYYDLMPTQFTLYAKWMEKEEGLVPFNFYGEGNVNIQYQTEHQITGVERYYIYPTAHTNISINYPVDNKPTITLNTFNNTSVTLQENVPFPGDTTNYSYFRLDYNQFVILELDSQEGVNVKFTTSVSEELFEGITQAKEKYFIASDSYGKFVHRYGTDLNVSKVTYFENTFNAIASEYVLTGFKINGEFFNNGDTITKAKYGQDFVIEAQYEIKKRYFIEYRFDVSSILNYPTGTIYNLTYDNSNNIKGGENGELFSINDLIALNDLIVDEQHQFVNWHYISNDKTTVVNELNWRFMVRYGYDYGTNLKKIQIFANVVTI